MLDRARRWTESVIGVLCVDANLDGVAVDADVFLPVSQRLSLGDPNHGLHQVHAAHFFGDGVLYLNSSIHLDEVVVTRIHVVEKLDGSRSAVVHRFRESDSR